MGEASADNVRPASGDGVVRFERRGVVGWVTLDRPRARNALTFGMYAQLAALLADAAALDGLRALVVTGAGGAFAAGTDIAEFRAFQGAADGLAYEARIGAVLAALEDCPLPTIAAIDGACTGGGLAIAACCDLRLGSAAARLGMPIARTLGNTLSLENFARLFALIGPARVTELVFTARLIDAAEAQRIGLLGEVLPDAEVLAARAETLAETVAGHAPLTLRATKQALRRLRAAAASDADLLALCYGSDDFRHGVEAFVARRPPVWHGR